MCCVLQYLADRRAWLWRKAIFIVRLVIKMNGLATRGTTSSPVALHVEKNDMLRLTMGDKIERGATTVSLDESVYNL